MSALQRRLIAFLDAELDHSLGSYRVARDRLAELERSLAIDKENTGKTHGDFLSELAHKMRRFNHGLSETVTGLGTGEGDEGTRQPAPNWLPFSNDLVSDEPVRASDDLTRISEYYSATAWGLTEEDHQSAIIKAIKVHRGELRRDDDAPGSKVDAKARARRAVKRAARYDFRREQAHLAGIKAYNPHGAATSDTCPAGGDPPSGLPGILSEISSSHLEADGSNPLGMFVMRALTDAHLLMHVVDAYRSRPIGRRLADRRGSPENQIQHPRITAALARSVALNTFVWTLSRSAPWVFAENEQERIRIANGYVSSWRNCRPMRAMWIGTQLSLLAIYRRSHALMLSGEFDAAYQDLHKLQASIRDVSRRLRRSSMQVDGAIRFLDTLDALADFRIGMLYRESGDQSTTLRYLQRTHGKLGRLKQGDRATESVLNSRWAIKLQLALGLSSYELGRHKAAIRWYLMSWRSLMEMLGAMMGGRLTIEPLDAAIDWLTLVEDEPELHKFDLSDVLCPAVEQIEAFRVDERFRAIAAEILLRLGHILFVLDLEDAGDAWRGARMQATADQVSPGSVAWILLRRAFVLDPASTLANSNLLRAGLRAQKRAQDSGTELPKRLADAIGTVTGTARGSDRANGPVKAKHQWAGARSPAAGLSHLFDATMLRNLWEAEKKSPPSTAAKLGGRRGVSVAEENERVARDLTVDFLMHTDSVEVRKSQVYANLAKERSAVRATGSDAAALEFICLRRYSSAYPILPRPRDFRSDGGGYFVRVHPGGGKGRALGIAVDPGTGFIDCLYRERLSVADVDVIIVTHDHVDHASALEPLLVLRYEAGQIRGRGSQQPIWLLGNHSVHSRMALIKQFHPKRSETKADEDLDAAGRAGHSPEGAAPEEHDPSTITFVDLSAPDAEGLSTAVAGINERLREYQDPTVANCPVPSLRLTPLPSASVGAGVGHLDSSENPSVGILLELETEEGTTRSIAIGGDLPNIPDDAAWGDEWNEALNADLFVAHLSTVPMTELRKLSGLGPPKPGSRLGKDSDWVNKHAMTDQELASRFAYGLWLTSDASPNPVLGPVEFGIRLRDWQAPAGHPYLAGILNLARAFRDRASIAERTDGSTVTRQFLIGELSEELGSVRNKVAQRINEHVFRTGDAPLASCQATTSDLGMRSVLSTAPKQRDVRMLCSTCALDYDLSTDERIHPLSEMTELCVKGENEGIFYSCTEHQPGGNVTDPTFVERHERFDVFGR